MKVLAESVVMVPVADLQPHPLSTASRPVYPRAITGPATFIYGLVDPRDKQIRYVGKANDPGARYRAHLTPRCLRAKTRKNAWLKSLLGEGLRPSLLLLDRVPVEKWENAERYWILFFLFCGLKLTNGTLGGDGMHAPSAEVRAKMGAKQRGKPSWNKGRPMTDEDRERARACGLWASRPGFWKGKHLPEHVIEALRRSHVGKSPANKGVPISESARLKLSSDWIVNSPTGERFEVRNLAAFCREHGLTVPLMNKVAHRERAHHRGWTCQKADGTQA